MPPELGTFISEDSLLGSPEDPPGRHLYAYAQGDPIDGWDPDGLAALGTCGGFGCVARPLPAGRYLQWKAFWQRFPSYDCGYHCLYVQPKSGTGIGGAFLAFMRWIMNSGRLGASRWWNFVNRQIVQSSLTAWHAFDLGYPTPSGVFWSGYARYIRRQYIKSFSWSTWRAGYYGGTDRQAWDAHQEALWIGVHGASHYYPDEKRSERLVIWKVLVNVEAFYRSGLPLDALLDPAIGLANYPMHYPATRSDACHMRYIGGTVTSYVSARVTPPSIC
jgi:hypothetical protein